MGVDMTTGILPTKVYVDESTHRLLVSAIVTGGSPSGTEYTEGNTDASFNGFVIMGEKPGDTAFPLQINASGELIVAATATIAKDTLPVSAITEAVSVAIVDGSGNQITSFGGGTQYTEDAVSAGDPVGNATILVRKDTPGAIVTTDGDNVAQRGTNYGAAYTQIVTSGGAFVDTFGGGTQYTEGDVDATITGTASLMEVAGNTLQPIQGTVADGLLVNLGTNNDVTVTGSVSITGTPAVTLVSTTITGSVAVTNAGITTIAGAVSGTEMQVDVLTMPTVAVTGTFYQATQPISGTVAFSNTTIAVTNVGTFATQIDGAALTALQLIDDPVVVMGTATYTEASSKGMTISAVRRDADTTLVDTTNEFAPLIVDARGFLKVEAFSGETLPVSIASGGNVQYTEGDTDATITGNAFMYEGAADDLVMVGEATPLPVDISYGTMPSVTPSSNSAWGLYNEDASHSSGDLGHFMLGIRNDGGVTSFSDTDLDYTPLATDQKGRLLVTTSNNEVAVNIVSSDYSLGLYQEDSAHTSLDVGQQILAVRHDADNSLVDTDGDYAPLQVDAVGRLKVEVFSGETLPVNDQPATTGGLSKFHLVGAATDNATNVKASAGQVYSITAFNLNASPRYLKFHNTAGTPTAGTGVTDTFLIPGNTAGAGLVLNIDKGITFSTGIGISIVTGIADASTTAISASEVVVNVYYK